MNLEQLRGRTTAPLERVPVTGVVARSDDTGVWVTVEGEDVTTPTGPCFGGARLVDGDRTQLDVDTVVLIVWTDDGPWIAQWEESA